MHISFSNFKLRHICVFSIKKAYEIKKKPSFFRHDGVWKINYWLNYFKKIKLKFLDIDKIIEKDTNMKISEIFEKKGEKFFRNLEEKITIKSLNLSKNIISLGGGGFLNEKIRKEVLTNHLLILVKLGF